MNWPDQQTRPEALDAIFVVTIWQPGSIDPAIQSIDRSIAPEDVLIFPVTRSIDC
jgi:hypothetical protein